MSNGPRSSRRSVHIGRRSIRAASIGVDRAELPDLPEAFAIQAAQPASDLLDHALRNARAEIAIRPRLVALDADVETGIEHDGDGQRVPAPREFDPRLAVRGAHIGGVDHSEAAVLQPLAGDGRDKLEGVGGSGLVVLVVADEAAAAIRRDHLRRLEPARGEARLARARRADQHDEAEIGNVERSGVRRPQRENTPTCETGPNSG